MIYFTRHEQRIVILLGIVLLLGTGLLLIKRFQPGWVMRLSMGEPDFDVEKDERSPRLKDDSSMQEVKSDPQMQKQQPSQQVEGDPPRPTEPPPQDQPTQTDGSDMTSKKTHPKARININTASKEELETLPGIGPTLAQRIIDYRKTYGKFINIHELTDVSGIGDATLQKVREQITVEEHDGSE